MSGRRSIEQFSTGANRSSSDGKIDYEGFLSPLSLEAFGEYMTKHRVMPDGSARDSDNWQKGIPLPRYMKSLWRHVYDAWSIHRGIRRFDKDDGHEITIQEALCAVLFNAQGYLHEHIKAEKKSVAMAPISIDMDGVLGNFTDAARPIIEEVIGHQIADSLYPPTSWNWDNIIGPGDMYKIWEKIKAVPNFWFKEKPFKENVFALQMFVKLFPQQELHFITSRVKGTGDAPKVQTENWLNKYGLFPRDGRSHVTVCPPDKKVGVMKAHNIKFSIDDKPETVQQINRQYEVHVSFLLTQPWNKNCDPTNITIPRVTDMASFLQKVLYLQGIPLEGGLDEALT